ncbi:hypothetical protein HanPSC8_Chr03g0090901 [Helianthus annuus]|nr:hypothetical protein HanIR_Chr03g0103101 [Helianthus annuus]KAJ0942347.1 hypothetical protein HanPSC8_Chr03g0090901 [Helianthus annuus]
MNTNCPLSLSQLFLSLSKFNLSLAFLHHIIRPQPPSPPLLPSLVHRLDFNSFIFNLVLSWRNLTKQRRTPLTVVVATDLLVVEKLNKSKENPLNSDITMPYQMSCRF